MTECTVSIEERKLRNILQRLREGLKEKQINIVFILRKGTHFD